MRCRHVVALLVLFFGFQTVRTYGQVTATWTDSTGNWSTPGNWSTNTVPNNSGGTTYQVVINGTGHDTVTYDVNGTVINSLSVRGEEKFQDSASGPSLNTGSLTVDGTNPDGSRGSATFNWTHGGTLITGPIDVSYGGVINIANSPLQVTGYVVIHESGVSFQNSNATISGGMVVGPLSGLSVTSSNLVINGSLVFGENFAGVVITDSSLRVGGDLSLGEDTNPSFTGSNILIGGNYSNFASLFFFSGLGLNSSKMQVGGDFSTGGLGGLGVAAGSALSVAGNLSNTYGLMDVSNSTVTVSKDFSNSGSGPVPVEIAIAGQIALRDGSCLVVNGDFKNIFMSGETINSSLKLMGSGNSATFGSVHNDDVIQVDQGSSFKVTTGGMTNTSNGSFTLGGKGDISGGFTNAGGAVMLTPTAVLVADTYSQSSGTTDIFGRLRTDAYTQSGGSTTIESGGKLTTNSFTATGGTVTVNGTLDPAAVTFASGTSLQGTGTIIGNVIMAGTLTPGLPGAPGTFTISGNYQQLDKGTLVDLMSPLSQSLLNVSGNVVLGPNSILQISLLNGFNPLGLTFDVMNYNALFGQFANGTSFWGDGYLWNVSYSEKEIEVTAVSATPEPGSFLFLGLGLLVLMAILRRKNTFRFSQSNCNIA